MPSATGAGRSWAAEVSTAPGARDPGPRLPPHRLRSKAGGAPERSGLRKVSANLKGNWYLLTSIPEEDPGVTPSVPLVGLACSDGEIDQRHRWKPSGSLQRPVTHTDRGAKPGVAGLTLRPVLVATQPLPSLRNEGRGQRATVARRGPAEGLLGPDPGPGPGPTEAVADAGGRGLAFWVPPRCGRCPRC